MRIEFLTLKSKPIDQQIQMTNNLLELDSNLGKKVRRLVKKNFRPNVASSIVTQSPVDISRLAILTIVQADILTIPAQIARDPYQERFEALCGHFGVDLDDVSLLIECVSQIEDLLPPDPDEE